MRWLVCVLVAVLAAFTSSEAPAQSAKSAHPLDQLRWLVVPTVAAGAAPLDATVRVESLHAIAEAFRQELAARGESVWRAERASERFEALGSAPAPELSQRDIDLWVERSRAAVRYLARADYKAARRELKAAQRLANRAAAELNREAARAQQVLDTCLFMVRAYVETKNDAEARQQARECRRLVPSVEPSAFRHTPEVRELLTEVDEEMASEAPGSVEVLSTPPGCLLRINGVDFGRTPLTGIELPVGSYRMQVECEEEQRGRIHRVGVESGANVFAFDAALDRTVHSRSVLHLQYESPDAWGRRMNDARSVARVLGGAKVLVLSALSADALRVDLSAAGFDPASTWVSVREGTVDAGDIRRATDAMLEGRSVDFTGPHPMAGASWSVRLAEIAAVSPPAEPSRGTGPEQAAPVPRPRNQRIAGWSLFGVGLASLGTSIGLHVWRDSLAERFIEAPADLSAAQQWNDVGIGVWATAAFAGVATSAAMPLVLPDYPRSPWWGWAVGAAGVGLTAYAIYEGVTLSNCPEPYIADQSAVRACASRGQESGRLALALAGAAPLLTIPLVYLFRPLRVEPSLSVTRDGATLRIRKAF